MAESPLFWMPSSLWFISMNNVSSELASVVEGRTYAFEHEPLRACRQRPAGRIGSSSSVQAIEFKGVNVGSRSAAIASVLNGELLVKFADHATEVVNQGVVR